MNETVSTILNHVSVRKFSEQKLTQEEIKTLVAAAQAASTASYQQSYSIIGVEEPRLMKEIAAVAGNQPFIAEGGHFFVFCADLYRIKKMAEAKGIDLTETLSGIDASIVGAVDASLAAQNLAITAESMGLGICYIGGVRDAIIEITELLDLPDYVYPVFGIAVGHPIETNEKNHGYHLKEFIMKIHILAIKKTSFMPMMMKQSAIMRNGQKPMLNAPGLQQQ